jgi:hypothetical protein
VDVGDPEQIAIGHRAETGFVGKPLRPIQSHLHHGAGGAEMPQLSRAAKADWRDPPGDYQSFQ